MSKTDPAILRLVKNARCRKWRQENPGKQRIANQAWLSKDTNRVKAREVSRRWKERHPAQARAASDKWRINNPDKAKAAAKHTYFKLRVQLISAYGGKCVCCGEDTLPFLTLDHIYNDGKQERAEVGGSTRLFRKLRAEGFPQGRHQVLCFNCNLGRNANGGICPHENYEDRKHKLSA